MKIWMMFALLMLGIGGCEPEQEDNTFQFEPAIGESRQALAADEPTDVSIENATGVLTGNFKICRKHYMAHLWGDKPGQDLGLYEIQFWGYYHQGRCSIHNVPARGFEYPRSLIIGRDGRFVNRFEFPVGYDGSNLVPFREGDVQPTTPVGEIYIGPRILRMKLIPDAGDYRVGNMFVNHNMN